MASSKTGHRAAVGGLWEEMGKLQFDFMVSQGLTPKSYLLDVGCGSLRGGKLFINYLEPGHYYGLEKEGELLWVGVQKELGAKTNEGKQPIFLVNHSFDLSGVQDGILFDYALAQSVFTHLTPDLINLCLTNVMERTEKFYATFWITDSVPMSIGKPHARRRGEISRAAYSVASIKTIAEDNGLHFEFIGDWNHPRGQQMGVFTKK